MRNILAIAGREVRAYFATPIAYVLLAVYLGFAGYFFYALLISFNQMLQIYSMMRNPEVLQRINLNEMVIRPLLQNMSVLLIFTVPAITMRMFPEERRSGTYELLLTSPVRITEIVLGKFLGGSVVLLSMIAVSAIFPVILTSYGNPEIAMMASGYLGLILVAIAFLAIGTLISSFTESFVVAYQSALGVFLGLYTVGWLADTLQGRPGDIVRYLSITDHFQDLTKGVIDTKNLVYFTSLVIVPLFVSVRSVESIRWRDVSVGGQAPLFGVLGLVFILFGFGGGMLVGWDNPYMVLNLVIGCALLLAYIALVSVRLRALMAQRSTRHWAAAVVYTALFVLFIGGVNFVGARRHHRWDLTESGVYTLSAQSKKVAEALQQPIQMTAFVEGGTNPQLETLLDSYRYASNKVETRIVDPDKEPVLVDQMKITTAPSVHLRYGNESFVVTQPSEETITNGVIRVTRSTKKVVYFTEGFGEADPQSQDPKGYSAPKLALDQENYEVKNLLLPSTDTIPDDASVVVIAGPTRPLTEPAIRALDGYLKRGGHLLVLVASRSTDERLMSLLADWGVKVGNDIVIDREVRLFEGPRLGVVPLSRTYGSHPITQGFKDYTTFPQTRTVEPETNGKKGLTATPLVKTSATSWAETNVDDVFNKGVATVDDSDRKGPLSVATAVTANLKEMGIEGATGGEARLVVFGTPMLAENQQIAQSRLNGDLFLNAVGWLVGQEELVSIRSPTVRASHAQLTPEQAGQLFYLSMKIIPELLIATGFIVWWRRRSA